MGNFATINTRILNALESAKSPGFIADDSVSWSGPEVYSLTQSLRVHIETLTLPRSRVGINFPNSAVQAVAILAVLSSNRVPVIFNHADVANDLSAWLERGQLSLLITSPSLHETLDKQEHIPAYLTLSPQGRVVKLQSKSPLAHFVSNLATTPPDGTALMIFTSGSTGQPKGIFVPSQGLCDTADFLIPNFGLGKETVAPTILPVCHSLTLNTHFIPTVLAGGSCFFLDSQLDFNKIYRIILHHKATFISLIGEVLRACWDEMNRRKLPRAEHVLHLQLAGGMITEHHLRLARELFPQATIHKGYGLTEGIRVSMLNSQSDQFLTSSVGTPLPFVDIQVRDETNLVITDDAVGEIFIKGSNVALGASGDARLPIDENGYLATGDLGYWNEQKQLCITGRKDSVFKINGHRVSGIEIETAALQLSNVIRNAKTILVEDEQRGRNKLVLLLEVPRDHQSGFQVDFLQELHQKMWQKFETMAYFPREVFLLTQFPRTSNGKIALKKMKELYLESERETLVSNNQTALQFFGITERMI